MMDVPFTSSGAMSRSQYALVRRVEGAGSVQQADQYLVSEVQAIQRQLALPTLSLKQCKECLVMLLYCSMAITSSFENTMDFALPHAVHLAESGRTTQDKRMGYLFCTEMMSPGHELQLMLVNTLRKDLESPLVPLICLALDTLIHSPFNEIVPAVQNRLYDLLSHNSLHVRRRALMAIRALSRQDSTLLTNVVDKVIKRLKDPQPIVISAGLTVALDLLNLGNSKNKVASVANELLEPSWQPEMDRSEYWFLLRVLRILGSVGPSPENVQLILRIIEWAANSNAHAHPLLYECFVVLSSRKIDLLNIVRSSPSSSPVLAIRGLLTSEDPNEQFLVMSCLECLDVAVWAGTTPEVPGVLDAWEVEHVMKLLDSQDSLIRKKTLTILNSVDSAVVESYLSRLLQSVPDSSFLDEKNECAVRALEVLETVAGQNGEVYAGRLKEILVAFEDENDSMGQHVLDKVVEIVLLRMRTGEELFRVPCVKALLEFLTESDARHGVTLMVILTALATEYVSVSSVPPVDLLRGLASGLSQYPSSIQDACLLAMLRISADCDELSPDVLDSVSTLSDRSSRHIQRRCDQFINLSGQKDVMRDIISKAHSSSLPDFLVSLESHVTPPPPHAAHPHSPDRRARLLRSPDSDSSRQSLAGNKLRYAAYDAPKPVARLRRPSSSNSSERSSGSAIRSDHSRSSVIGSPALSERRGSLEDERSRTVTAGDLALVAGDPELREIDQQSRNSDTSSRTSSLGQPAEDSIRADLIAFDSPFTVEPPDLITTSNDEPDFEMIWNKLDDSNLRGWCESSIDAVVRQLQGLRLPMRVIAADQQPFEGDLKALISAVSRSDAGAAIRLRESDDESCLWRLRCNDVELRTRIKRLLAE